MILIHLWNEDKNKNKNNNDTERVTKDDIFLYNKMMVLILNEYSDAVHEVCKKKP